MMSSKVKVVYLIENLALGGGIETVIWGLLRGISNERYEIHPWFLAETGESFERMKKEYPQTFFLNLKNYHRPDNLFRLASRLKESGADLVHLHGYFAGSFGRLVAPFLGIPWVYSMYSHYEDVYRLNNYLMERWLSKSRGVVVACSEAVKKFAVERCRVSPNKVIVNYEGADVLPQSSWPSRQTVRAKFQIPDGSFVVGTVTRFYPGKNTKLIIRSFASLPVHCHLLLAGEGPERSELEELARSLGISERVHFAGLLSDVSFAYLAMDVFVQSSLIREGFSMALVEAMGYSRPIIATAVGGNIEAVSGGAGWLVPSDDAALLSETINYLIQNPEELKRAAGIARNKYLSGLTSSHMAEGMMVVYDRLLRITA